MKFNRKEREGVFSVAKVFVEKLGWIFREQPINDFGVDALVESTIKVYLNAYKTPPNLKDSFFSPTGKLLALQIKSGESYFEEINNYGIIFRGETKHIKYWSDYSIQVAIILHHPRKEESYWQIISDENIIRTKKAWKIIVPWKNVLDEVSIVHLEEAATFKNAYERKLSLFRNCESLIDELLDDKDRFLYVRIWERSQKTPDSTFEIDLVFSDLDDVYPEREFHCGGYYRWNYLMGSNERLSESIGEIIPWADLFDNDDIFSEDKEKEMLFAEISKIESEFHQNSKLDPSLVSLASLACWLTGEHFLKFKLKAKHLATSFKELNRFLKD